MSGDWALITEKEKEINKDYTRVYYTVFKVDNNSSFSITYSSYYKYIKTHSFKNYYKFKDKWKIKTPYRPLINYYDPLQNSANIDSNNIICKLYFNEQVYLVNNKYIRLNKYINNSNNISQAAQEISITNNSKIKINDNKWLLNPNIKVGEEFEESGNYEWVSLEHSINFITNNLNYSLYNESYDPDLNKNQVKHIESFYSINDKKFYLKFFKPFKPLNNNTKFNFTGLYTWSLKGYYLQFEFLNTDQQINMNTKYYIEIDQESFYYTNEYINYIDLAPNHNKYIPINIYYQGIYDKDEWNFTTKNIGLMLNFTSAKNTGFLGPSSTQIINEYLTTNWKNSIQFVPNLPGIQKWAIPYDGIYAFIVQGAGGAGNIYDTKGKGAEIIVKYELKQNDIIYILVGQKGLTANSGRQRSGGGGGASYIWKFENNCMNLLVVAGGGGGNCGCNPLNVESSYIIQKNINASYTNNGKPGIIRRNLEYTNYAKNGLGGYGGYYSGGGSGILSLFAINKVVQFNYDNINMSGTVLKSNGGFYTIEYNDGNNITNLTIPWNKVSGSLGGKGSIIAHGNNAIYIKPDEYIDYLGGLSFNSGISELRYNKTTSFISLPFKGGVGGTWYSDSSISYGAGGFGGFGGGGGGGKGNKYYNMSTWDCIGGGGGGGGYSGGTGGAYGGGGGGGGSFISDDNLDIVTENKAYNEMISVNERSNHSLYKLGYLSNLFNVNKSIFIFTEIDDQYKIIKNIDSKFILEDLNFIKFNTGLINYFDEIQDFLIDNNTLFQSRINEINKLETLIEFNITNKSILDNFSIKLNNNYNILSDLYIDSINFSNNFNNIEINIIKSRVITKTLISRGYLLLENDANNRLLINKFINRADISIPVLPTIINRNDIVNAKYNENDSDASATVIDNTTEGYLLKFNLLNLKENYTNLTNTSLNYIQNLISKINTVISYYNNQTENSLFNQTYENVIGIITNAYNNNLYNIIYNQIFVLNELVVLIDLIINKVSNLSNDEIIISYNTYYSLLFVYNIINDNSYDNNEKIISSFILSKIEMFKYKVFSFIVNENHKFQINYYGLNKYYLVSNQKYLKSDLLNFTNNQPNYNLTQQDDDPGRLFIQKRNNQFLIINNNNNILGYETDNYTLKKFNNYTFVTGSIINSINENNILRLSYNTNVITTLNTSLADQDNYYVNWTIKFLSGNLINREGLITSYNASNRTIEVESLKENNVYNVTNTDKYIITDNSKEINWNIYNDNGEILSLDINKHLIFSSDYDTKGLWCQNTNIRNIINKGSINENLIYEMNITINEAII